MALFKEASQRFGPVRLVSSDLGNEAKLLGIRGQRTGVDSKTDGKIS